MPMKEVSDFALGDTAKDFCKYCAHPDGTMQSFDEKLEGMTDFILQTQGLDAAAAKEAALSMMAKLPAWKTHFA
jgi:hypothetical protein